MSDTPKLTRAEACQKLWDKQQLGAPATVSTGQPIPDYFVDRQAATLLVLWIKKQSVDVRESFQHHFAEIVSGGADLRSVRFFDALLATAEQITLAVCRTLRINVENSER